MLAIIDGDIIIFRAAFSAEDEPEAFIACGRASTMVEEILAATGATSYRIFVSGTNNFRYDIFPEYKANRLDAKRPKWEKEVKEFLIRDWGAERSEGCEADDLIGIEAYKNLPKFGDAPLLEEGNPWPPFIICTIDKDLDQIPGWHYNFVKKEKYVVSEEEAIRWFYYQLLVGDTADGIKGVPYIGPKKASRILANCESEREMFQAVREAYGVDEAFEMNAKVLWIWKKENDIWQWPERYQHVVE